MNVVVRLGSAFCYFRCLPKADANSRHPCVYRRATIGDQPVARPLPIADVAKHPCDRRRCGGIAWELPGMLSKSHSHQLIAVLTFRTIRVRRPCPARFHQRRCPIRMKNRLTTAQSTLAIRRRGVPAILTLATAATLAALTAVPPAKAAARQARPAPPTEATAPRDAGQPIMAIVSIKSSAGDRL